ncbi:MAG: hypothetical protein Q8P41_13435 [Pseudomonadota bacterium]|nr:hypothetical protein [Pseudomonadota bacterium]
MKKWLPYVVAAVLGLGVAILAFGPGMGGGDSTEKPPVAAKGDKKKVQTVNFGEDGTAIARSPDETRTPAEIVEEAKANPPPPPGTLRPQNKAEIEHSARLARPFNQHFAHVSAFWSRAAQLTGKDNPDLARECSAMSRYMRDQGNLNDDAIDIAGTIAKEQALAEKLRAAADGNEELVGVADYITEASQAVLDGKDPTLVQKPSAKKASAGQ